MITRASFQAASPLANSTPAETLICLRLRDHEYRRTPPAGRVRSISGRFGPRHLDWELQPEPTLLVRARLG
jgi:hypothetical protein